MDKVMWNRGSLNRSYASMYMLLSRRVRQRWGCKGSGRWSHAYPNVRSQIFSMSECYYVEKHFVLVEEYFVSMAFGAYYREFSSVSVMEYIH